MKIAMFRPYGLLAASLLCVAGAALVVANAATAAEAATASKTAATPPAAPTVPGTGTGTGTGTEADAAPPSSVASTDEHGTDWEAHDSQDDDADRDAADDHGSYAWRRRHRYRGTHDGEVVNIAADSVLEAGKEADSVVSVLGNSRVEGTVHEDVVSVFGNTRVDGNIGGNAVAVFGNTYVDSKIGGDTVAVFGNVELGPHAEIGGDVVTVLGTQRRDPAAIVHGDSRSVFAHDFAAPGGLRSWIEHCLLYGRPLSLARDLGWAWGLALSLLAFYLCIALVFRGGVERCVETFERQPGHSVLAALLAVLLTPVLIALLCITVVGIVAVPFVAIGVFCIALFGKAVILAWLGGRVLRVRGTPASGALATPHPALAVLIGGLIALALYLVPFFGFVVYKLLGFLGFGAVVYTAILGLRARQTGKNGDARAAAATVTAPEAMSAAARATLAGSATMSGAAGTAAAAAAAASEESTSPAGSVPPSYGGPPTDSETPRRAAPLSPAITSELPRAGFWIRMAALALDVLLVGLVTSLLHSSSHGHLILLAAYGAVMWKLRGSTVGGIVCDLRVVRLDGRDMDWETSIIRALSCFLSLAVAGLGFFWIAFDDANQAWHDKIAGTLVVRVPKAPPRV